MERMKTSQLTVVKFIVKRCKNVKQKAGDYPNLENKTYNFELWREATLIKMINKTYKYNMFLKIHERCAIM